MNGFKPNSRSHDDMVEVNVIIILTARHDIAQSRYRSGLNARNCVKSFEINRIELDWKWGSENISSSEGCGDRQGCLG